MRRLRLIPLAAVLLGFLSGPISNVGYAQTGLKIPLQLTYIPGITSAWPGECAAGVIDNRSAIARLNNYHALQLTSATGTWSAALNYSDTSCTGPWTSFGATAAMNQASNPAVAFGNGYHPYIQTVITGNAVVAYAGQNQLPLSTSVGALSFPVTIGQGGTNSTTAAGALANLLNGNAQGTYTNKVQMAGTNSGTSGAALCNDGSGNATTTGCAPTFPTGSPASYLQIAPNAGNSTTYRWNPLATTDVADYVFSPYSCNNVGNCSPGGSSGASIATGSNAFTFAPVPLGLSGTHTVAANLPHGLYVSGGTGTAEMCVVSGGSGTSGSASGQIIINCANNHTGAFTIQSNSQGIQEAIYAAGTSGAVRFPGGGVYMLQANIPPNGTYPLGVAAVTIPSGYNTSLRGQARYATLLETVFTTGDAIRFECPGSCSGGGSGGIGDLADMAILDANNANHTGGAMVRIRYRADLNLNNLFINNAWDGIVNEGGIRFNHHDFTVGTSHFGYAVSCKDPSGGQANYPDCLSTGLASNFQISSATSGTHAIHIESPTAGVTINSPQTGAASNTANASIYITAIGTNPWNEIEIGGDCVLDGHLIGVQIVGNGSSYTDNTINVSNCRINAAQYDAFLSSYVQSVNFTNNFLGAAVNGAGSDIGVVLIDHVQQASFVNNRILTDGPCFGSAGATTFGYITIKENNCGLPGTSPPPPVPSSGVGFFGTFAGLTVTNNDFSAATTPIANTFTATNFLAANNRGVDDVIPAVASAATLTAPFNPTFTITGTTNITSFVFPLIAGSKFTFLETNATPPTWTAGTGIGKSFTPAQNIPVSCFWDGSLAWCRP